MKIKLAGLLVEADAQSKVYTSVAESDLDNSEIAITKLDIILGSPIEYISCVGANKDSVDLRLGSVTENGIEIRFRRDNIHPSDIQTD